ncbi:MAG TPA: PD-(D/E)XK nuclease family protein [Gammaproteobacteria bacterium]|nr:PD-(D/E)XK nuclease family protein [Gammaproteobacteria bacterium]
MNHSVLIAPYGHDPLAVLADEIVQQASLPDLTNSVILLPTLSAAPRLRRLLLERAQAQGNHALLGPNIDTLRGWMERHVPITGRVISESARALLLVEALAEHPDLFGGANPWRIADGLLRLFDELTLRQAALPTSLKHFTARLAHAYGLPDGIAAAALGDEARVVYTLWQALRNQLQAEHKVDAHSAYVSRLCDRSIPGNLHFYLVGFHELYPAELAWSKALHERGQLSLILHGDAPEETSGDEYAPDAPLVRLRNSMQCDPMVIAPNDDFTDFVNTVYAPSNATLAVRASEFAERHSNSPATGRLSVFAANGAEEEAKAVDIQVRRWLIEGRSAIGIVSEDRRLARRIRALLERAGVTLQDAAGWALSTTSAASTIERWLQTVEQDFAHDPMLDLLKSSFVFPDRDRDNHLDTVYRLERDIIRRANLPRGLHQYRKHVTHLTEGRVAIAQLLADLERASQPLLPLSKGHTHHPQTLLNALQESLQRLGITQALAHDAAGQRILAELEALQQALPGRSLRMNWREFRAWLARSLETAHFVPNNTGSPVQLLALEQTALCRFDALIIAGADHEHLPGGGPPSPFFNSAVRRDLGLATRHDELCTRFYHFRRLLECAPQVTITLRREQDGEPVLPSPWVEALQSFHFLAYGDRLDDQTLAVLVNEPRAQISHADPYTLPARTVRPRPAIDRALVPDTLSARAHQRLIDCPYQFFAAHALQLRVPEEVQELLEKSDFGERVHRILQAFHCGAQDLPGPFIEVIATENRVQAIHRLTEISQAVFAPDLKNNFVHRAWLARWLAIIPHYIDWQIAQEGSPLACEVSVRSARVDGLTLTGRLDRVDRGRSGLRILDYKTGQGDKQVDVSSGEATQLIFYTLLAEHLYNENIERVEYLLLDKEQVKPGSRLEGEELHRLSTLTAQRLDAVMLALREGSGAPAWGDPKTCERCDMQGLCRRQAWPTTESRHV